MSPIPSLVLIILLTLQLQRICCEERRTDVMRAVLSGPAEPGFWPSRGRRSDTSSEEEPPPFWAHRGRGLSVPCPGADLNRYLLLHQEEPFWLNARRKRSQDH